MVCISGDINWRMDTCRIFWKREQPREKYPYYLKFPYGNFYSTGYSSRNFRNFRLNGSHIGNLTIFGSSRNFQRKFSISFACVLDATKVLVEWRSLHVFYKCFLRKTSFLHKGNKSQFQNGVFSSCLIKRWESLLLNKSL